ncbi:hypothetical protein GGI12_001673 [Dipsacomyces acuminosporus]|nr:hypothetical protein GGI12_001673 [Dipsacomyces acuminosporus]
MRFFAFAPVLALASLASAAPILATNSDAPEDIKSELADNSNQDQFLPIVPLIGPALTFAPLAVEGVKKAIEHGPQIVQGVKNFFGGKHSKGKKHKRALPEVNVYM